MKKLTAPYKKWLAIAIIMIVATTVFFTFKSLFISKADNFLSEAQALMNQHEFQKAKDLFESAWLAYRTDGKNEKANLAHALMYKAGRAGVEYLYTKTQLEQLLAEKFPEIAQVERNAWIQSGKIDSISKNGQIYYDMEALPNLLFRNKALIHDYNQKRSPYGFMKEFNFVFNNSKLFLPAINNKAVGVGTYEITETVKIPRQDLPQTGNLKIWMPLPIEKEDQKDIQILALEPSENLTAQPNTKADIGLAGFEFSLNELKEDVAVTAKFRFKHYEQNFKINPTDVGTYDKNSELYKQYTRSYANTSITPEITKKAKEIVGSETNPYLQAKKVYEYILNNVYYSFMPYVTLGALDKPITQVVHEKGYGDCGAQSMYFTALMRSLGVPARTTGGHQMLLNQIGGHFWAEFYLPNYGWIPVDTTVAEGADDAVNISEKDKNKFKEYYFGNLDHFRYNIQKDVDLPVQSPWQDPPLVPPAIQQATAECNTCERDLNMDIAEKYWGISLKVIR